VYAQPYMLARRIQREAYTARGTTIIYITRLRSEMQSVKHCVANQRVHNGNDL
jgi:hypothetical protein